MIQKLNFFLRHEETLLLCCKHEFIKCKLAPIGLNKKEKRLL